MSLTLTLTLTLHLPPLPVRPESAPGRQCSSPQASLPGVQLLALSGLGVRLPTAHPTTSL